MQLIIFDCDGTLVDSQHLISAAMTQTFELQGLIPPPLEQTRTIIGLSLSTAIKRLAPSATPLEIDALCDGYRQAHLQIRTSTSNDHEPFFEGIAELIETLDSQEHRMMAIATGKARRGLLSLLERKKLKDKFVSLQTADDAPSKPHPAMLEQALDETGAEPDNSLMIGDSTFDILMAKNAGIQSIGVAWGYQPVEHLVEAGADDIASDPSNLLSLIDKRLT